MTLPADVEALRKITDRLEAAYQQVGHPDYSLGDFYEGVKHAVFDLRALATKAGEGSKFRDCKDCPHKVGDASERDCCFPDCVGGWQTYAEHLEEQLATTPATPPSRDAIVEECAREALAHTGPERPDWSQAEFPENVSLEVKLAYAYAKGQNDQCQNIFERIRALKSVPNTQGEDVEAMYQKVVKIALECDPIPACKRANDQLEPPWEVFARVKRARAELEQLYGAACLRLQALGEKTVALPARPPEGWQHPVSSPPDGYVYIAAGAKGVYTHTDKSDWYYTFALPDPIAAAQPPGGKS